MASKSTVVTMPEGDVSQLNMGTGEVTYGRRLDAARTSPTVHLPAVMLFKVRDERIILKQFKSKV